MKRVVTAFVVTLAAAISIGAHGYEFENAVPLTIGGKLTNPQLSNLVVKLDGHEVTVTGDMSNDSAKPVTYGFFAYTPLFLRYGDGEEHEDKRFADLRVSVDGTPVTLYAEHRGFFLGKDVTGVLNAAGLSPLPNQDDDPAKLAHVPAQFGIAVSDGRDWEGLVTYSWVTTVKPSTKGTMRIVYQALPQFGLEELSSERFFRLIEQHCGDAKPLAKRIAKTDPSATAVLMERFAIPVSLINRASVHLDVSQPKTNSMGARPVAAFACGLPREREGTLPVAATIGNADNALSVLVVSELVTH